MKKYFKRLTDDLVFFRIVMVLWSLPIFSIVVFAIRDTSQFCGVEWLWLIPVLALALGAWLVYTATRTSDERFEKRLDVLADGGDWMGLIFVVVVLVLAIPVYEIVRIIRPGGADPNDR